jgi:hypothetical protein
MNGSNGCDLLNHKNDKLAREDVSRITVALKVRYILRPRFRQEKQRDGSVFTAVTVLQHLVVEM